MISLKTTRNLALTFFSAVLSVLLAGNQALAANAYTPSPSYDDEDRPSYVSPSRAYAQTGAELPDIISFGLGWFDIDKNTPRRQAFEQRFEYRWGMSLLSRAHNYFTAWDPYVQIHPLAGLQTSNRGQLYAYGGLAMDIFAGRHIIFTPSIVGGLYARGDGKDMGDVYEFRSTFEAGWRFDNEMRVVGYFGHLSNGGLGDCNPGAESAGLYVHVPVGVMFGR